MPATYLLVLLVILSLAFSSISLTFYFRTDPTPIFVVLLFASLVSFVVVTTGNLVVDLVGVRGVN